ncbi:MULTISPECIES: methylaspartate mutase subunit S [unclassified Oceanispirochaeta]|uniref:methylaspartate mutase subunit S n=1 Tax=unclassified Oceanispirochaeta TaxID=2635722 RepID=UPI000E090D35|nr:MULTISPECIES: methylaspartate mutase subunit S [unclassified Oceanispirochaeta]MBF9017921.1 methylaspartate mutase subunit S [Oceanispirochaeta sp. M2]NPD74432.1 methylaspartate mutase subunit S [Oceanispirochaeta sp. M1]RDG29732.1 methylaspartate mutase subunit S [Oceanispirochaeta sp. M1]
MNSEYKAVLVTGVIGEDVHVTGIRILEHALRKDGYAVHSLGIHNSQEDFINKAIEVKADAVLISSLAGHAEMLVQGFREKCDKADLKDIKLYIGGQLVIHAEEWAATEKRFIDLGFTAVAAPFNPPKNVLAELNSDLCSEQNKTSA